MVAAETTSLTQVYTEVKAAGGTIQEGVQFSVSSIIESPQFLYRTEFGNTVRNSGIDGLIKDLQTKNKSLEKGAKK